jgi:hypothetical protein
MIPGQRIAEMGQGATFEGASRDGAHVFFRSNAPLTPDDPNGGVSITAGSASTSSWDLYRYSLPASLDDDPVDGSLMRISGGPSGTADAATNVTGGAGTALRFQSDDGHRAYFVTTSPIAGADDTPPKGGVDGPAGAVANASVRNLYLFDDTSGSPTWRFVARLPYSTSGFDSCASGAGEFGPQIEGQVNHTRNVYPRNCFRGTPDGQTVVFMTTGQLTADDTDAIADLYVYEAGADELTRLTAPAPGATGTPFSCAQDADGDTRELCRGDLGSVGAWGSGGRGAAGLNEAARGWGGIRYNNLAVDDNGVVSVLFETQSQLLPGDVNGDYYDVYQWRNGELSLISPGQTEDDAWYSGNSLDGEDIFIWTAQRIDPRELDDGDFDLYDLRRGGGFPYTPPPTPCDVLAFECETEAKNANASPRAGSTGLAGQGNVQQKSKRPKCGKGKVRRKGKCVRKAKGARKAQRAANKAGRAHR